MAFDLSSSEGVIGLVRKLREEGAFVVMETDRPALTARRVGNLAIAMAQILYAEADVVIQIRNGKIKIHKDRDGDIDGV